MIQLLFFCVISYFVGSLPFGLWVGLAWKGIDIRTLGSKNIGATNVLRVLGVGPGITVFLLDTFKGMVGVLLAKAFWPDAPFYLLMLIGFLAIIGHTFSLFLRFKGGKGVATSFGVLLALSLPVALVGFVVWVSGVALTRYVSMAALAAGISLPIAAWLLLHGSERWWMVGLGVVLAVLVTVKHRGNIQRLLAGTEAKIGQRVETSTPPEETK